MKQMHRSIALAATCLLACLAALPARAQGPAGVAGSYCLQGVMEVGSCLKLHPNGRFEYFLAYGAYDEVSEGTWKIERGQVVLDSPAYDKRPSFAFKRMQRGEADRFDVIVETKAGRAIPGIDVGVTCDGRTGRAGVTSGGLDIACASPPTQIHLGVAMYGIVLQPVDVTGRAGSNRTYVFEFDPGDLGRKRFSAQRLTLEGDRLVMTYTGSPIPELTGRSFRYVRQ